MASSHIEDQEKASPKHRAHDTLWHRRTEDRKMERLLAPATVQPLQDQAEEILELVKRWKVEVAKKGVSKRSGEETGSAVFGTSEVIPTEKASAVVKGGWVGLEP